MNKKILALSLILVLTAVYLTSVSLSTVKAQTTTSQPTGRWITSYTVKNANNGATIIDSTSNQNGYVLEGDELSVTATIDISQSSPSTSLSLTTSLQHSSLQGNMYWQLDSTSYNLGNFNPNSRTITFAENQGTLQITCFGLVPTGSVTQTGPNGITLDIPTPLSLIVLQDPSGSTLDQVKVNITDAAIDNYLTILNSRENTLKGYKSSGVDAGFTQIYQNVIDASKVMEGQGFASAAIQMLNGLSVSSPPSASTAGLLIPIAVAMAAIAAVFAFLFIRIRGKVSYFQLVVEDQIKDLEGLTLRISKIDRMASSNLDSVKERLKRLVGM
ncbi:MAG: hypothetical protein ABSE15_04865 [Candidatus Bathyarchaeia archaeon]